VDYGFDTSDVFNLLADHHSELCAAIRDALEDQALGTIGEIFDGDPPHHPRGAPAQAWSVGCTLDAWRLLRQAEERAQISARRGPSTDVAGH